MPHPRSTPLRPDPDIIGQAWHDEVEAEYEQVERLREWHASDYYGSFARQFADDPRRTDDDTLDLLLAHSDETKTWLDIGSGGGRYALPLALHNKQVIAIEPSESMREVLNNSMREYGIDNIEIHAARWPGEGPDIQADFSLASHVGYDLRDINGFVDAQEAATRERCFVMMMDRAPSGGFVELFEEVHEEHRYQLPGAREFLYLLLARGVLPEVTVLERKTRSKDHDEHIASARRRLWLAEGSDKDQRMQELLAGRSLDADYQLPQMVACISWVPKKG